MHRPAKGLLLVANSTVHRPVMREPESGSKISKVNASIRTSHWGRVLIYWLPVVYAAYGIRILVNPELVDRFVDGPFLLLLAVAFVAASEYRLFGFHVWLFPDKLVYRYRGIPRPKQLAIARDNIVSFERKIAVRFDKKPWDFVEVKTRDSSVTICLASFTSKGKQQVLDWLALAAHG